LHALILFFRRGAISRGILWSGSHHALAFAEASNAVSNDSAAASAAAHTVAAAATATTSATGGGGAGGRRRAAVAATTNSASASALGVTNTLTSSGGGDDGALGYGGSPSLFGSAAVSGAAGIRTSSVGGDDDAPGGGGPPSVFGSVSFVGQWALAVEHSRLIDAHGSPKQIARYDDGKFTPTNHLTPPFPPQQPARSGSHRHGDTTAIQRG